MVGLWRCARGKCVQRIANRIVVVVSRWLWVVGLRPCARGKCTSEGCKSHWKVKESRDFKRKVARLWVVGLRRCARGSAFKELQMVSRWLGGRFVRGACTQRVAKPIVMVVSGWLWVVG